MQEVSAPGEKHRQPKFIACLDGILVTFAAAWMNDSCDAVLRSQAHRVIEGEEAIAREDSTTGSIARCLEGDPG